MRSYLAVVLSRSVDVLRTDSDEEVLVLVCIRKFVLWDTEDVSKDCLDEIVVGRKKVMLWAAISAYLYTGLGFSSLLAVLVHRDERRVALI